MATDLDAILGELGRFISLEGRDVLSVGAGGGQLAAYGGWARSVVAVDPDAAALERLEERVGALGLADRYSYVCATFETVARKADLVLFEFSLHEMEDAGRALAHALTLAPLVVVLDHAPGSPWAWHVLEEEKVARSWGALNALHPAEVRRVRAEQRFDGLEELLLKVQGQGEEAVARCRSLGEQGPVQIPMDYVLVRLERGA